jgi:hypothetical protein
MRTDSTPLFEAKEEYVDEIRILVAKNVYGVFFEMFIQCVGSNDEVELVFSSFQDAMEDIRGWNTETIQKYTRRVIAEKDDEFFSQLVTAVLILKTKIMTSFKIDNQQKNVQLKVPSTENFIHRLFTVLGNHFYNNPFVFVVDQNKKINTDRYKDCMQIIHSSINETLSFFVPVKNILREYIGIQEPHGMPPENQEPDVTPKEPEEKPDPEVNPEDAPKVDTDEVRTISTDKVQTPPVPEPPLVPSPLIPVPASESRPEPFTGDVKDSDMYPKENESSEESPDKPMLSFQGNEKSDFENHNSESQPRRHLTTFDSDSDSEYDYEPDEDEIRRESVQPERSRELEPHRSRESERSQEIERFERSR